MIENCLELRFYERVEKQENNKGWTFLVNFHLHIYILYHIHLFRTTWISREHFKHRNNQYLQITKYSQCIHQTCQMCITFFKISSHFELLTPLYRKRANSFVLSSYVLKHILALHSHFQWSLIYIVNLKVASHMWKSKPDIILLSVNVQHAFILSYLGLIKFQILTKHCQIDSLWM